MRKAIDLIEKRTIEIKKIRIKNPTACEHELKLLDNIKSRLLEDYVKGAGATKEQVKQYIREQTIKGVWGILWFKIKCEIKRKLSPVSLPAVPSSAVDPPGSVPGSYTV